MSCFGNHFDWLIKETVWANIMQGKSELSSFSSTHRNPSHSHISIINKDMTVFKDTRNLWNLLKSEILSLLPLTGQAIIYIGNESGDEYILPLKKGKKQPTWPWYRCQATNNSEPPDLRNYNVLISHWMAIPKNNYRNLNIFCKLL